MGRVLMVALFVSVWSPGYAAEPVRRVLGLDSLDRHVARFNAMAEETVTNAIPNTAAAGWLSTNIPLFECPDPAVEEIYYFRWWSFRKHLKHTPKGHVFTEFLTPVGHAGDYNTISCAAGHHVDEGRWLRDSTPVDDYILYWLRGGEGQPATKYYKFSSWLAAAAWDRYLVNLDREFVVGILDDLVADYATWEADRQLPSGLFWQHDVKDGMEESISGSRREEQARPTINSYMFGNAQAIAHIARLAGKTDIAETFDGKAARLQDLTLEALWDPDARFFEVKHPENGFSGVREEIGFIPWRFHLPKPNQGYEAAWEQLLDPDGFRAPFGITTAERRHPAFRTHGVGTCEWDGAVWPFATSQTLRSLAEVLRDYPQETVDNADYLDAFLTYVLSQHANGKPYIGEYLDEVTGDWIDRGERSAFYNHSTFADLLITGLLGLRPRADNRVEVHPLLPAATWDWFCLDGVSYHGRLLTLLWDEDGSHYDRGAGWSILVDGRPIARSAKLEPITGEIR